MQSSMADGIGLDLNIVVILVPSVLLACFLSAPPFQAM